ncbi:2-acylglycerol O-acyltransferase 2-A-like [Athalia rosae]|uniref:2-acylglycerol O-acyltransferase 2-A-like n=1 Tax=Athalia rosae TaxID=37344 RepID=UPI002033F696|nr:2-acylglycerol O-acyltransferase 2-A-like [Athalia rosae]XP_048512895.1 2-acylglycerol O-acyltransferase 2-A-like [Athalia rosae]XP_048512896.1 2-acylglycerol O-acyltransferase 2-A-like [Athalia rosae]
MELLGVKFAPLNTPLERRLQTLAAAAWIMMLVFGGCAGCVITALIIFYTTTLRYFIILYIAWYFFFDLDTCEKGGRSDSWILWMRNHAWWHYFCAYFPIKLVKTAELDPSKNYLLCAFPHGVLCTGAFGAFATDVLEFHKLFPGLRVRMLTLRQHFNMPLFREFVYSFGACSASAKSIEHLISVPGGGRATVLAVGGASESLKCKPGTYRIILKRRKGFVRIALKHGTPLVPVFSFGETDLYSQVDNPEGSYLRSIQEMLRKFTGIAPVLPIGRGLFQYSFGIIPQRRPVTVVVGEALDVPKIPEPTREQIDDYHTKFIEKLVHLFETNKEKYLKNAENTQLIID